MNLPVMDIFLSANSGHSINNNVALLTLCNAGLHLHHLHIVLVQGGGGGVSKVENIPLSSLNYIDYPYGTTIYLH